MRSPTPYPPFTTFNINNPENYFTALEGTFLLAYRGSIAHGMHIPSSDPTSIDDIDLIGGVFGRPSTYLGLDEWESRGTKEVKSGRYDAVFYEIRKLVRLLLAGNPNVLSLLWLKEKDYIYISEAAKDLLSARDLFVGRHVYSSFAGYAAGQLAKMERRDPPELRRYIAVTNELKRRGAHPNHKGECLSSPDTYDYNSGIAKDASWSSTEDLLHQLSSFLKKGSNLGYLGDKRKQLILDHGYDTKNAAHCIRLLRMAKEFLTTGVMNVDRSLIDAGELMNIKQGKWTLSDIKSLAEELFIEVKAARDISPLPQEPSTEKISSLVEELVWSYLSDCNERTRS